MTQTQPGVTQYVGRALPSSLHPGVTYVLERKLGEGGTAIAFLAIRHSREGQSPVVIKMILPNLALDSDERAMTIIKKEAVALGRLNERVPPSPYVVRLVDTGSAPYQYGSASLQLPWLALEYVHGGVEGTSLADRVTASVRATGFAFDPARAALCIKSLAQGLSEIHAEGVVHRDLTPGNVLCCGGGDSELFKISDFGFARPKGLTATFGDTVIGTPGYVALEQLDPNLEVGPYTDIFSLAAICYWVLTAEHYFPFKSIGESIIGLQEPARRSIRESPALAPELRGRDAACRAIDMALAAATAVNPAQRPANAQLFAESLLPWIWRERSPTRPSRRWITGLARIGGGEELTMRNWRVLHPPGSQRIVLSAAWNASGHALCSTTEGLCYWNGTQWLPTTTSLPISTVSFVRRMSPTSWLLGGEQGRLVEYSREGCRDLVRPPDQHTSFVDCAGDFEDIMVALGQNQGQPPTLYALVGNHWLKPLAVDAAIMITKIVRIDEECWLIVGRKVSGGAYAALYRPLLWALEPIDVPHGRALLGSAARWERQESVAVGSDGVVLEIQQDRISTRTLTTPVDLSSVAMDALGHRWATSPGRIWWSLPGGEWSCAHEQLDWQAPFVSLTAEVGMVSAMTADGGVLECRSDDNTAPG